IASLKQQIQELERRQEKTRSKRAWETLNGENSFSYVCDRGNHRGGIRKETLYRLGIQVEITGCVGKVPSNYYGFLCSLGMRVLSRECVDKAPYYPGFHVDYHDNPLLTKETESEPIIWDIGYEEEEYPFVNKYPSFQEPIVLMEEKSCPVYDTDNEEEESMPVYDTDIDDVIEEEERFVGKGGFGEEEDNIEDIVVVANDICSSMIQNALSVDVEEDVNTKSHVLMSFGKGIIIKVSQSLFKFLIRKKYQEWYLKVAPMVDKLGLKMIKVRGRVIIKKGNLMQEIQVWMLRVQGTSEENSRTSFSQAREDDAEALTFSQIQNA
ncbi:hypothetical protein Tco_0662458, partial [Tanacetum coccineum]